MRSLAAASRWTELDVNAVDAGSHVYEIELANHAARGNARFWGAEHDRSCGDAVALALANVLGLVFGSVNGRAIDTALAPVVDGARTHQLRPYTWAVPIPNHDARRLVDWMAGAMGSTRPLTVALIARMGLAMQIEAERYRSQFGRTVH